MAKFGKILSTGILAAAVAAGTYYAVKNKDEIAARVKDIADKIKNNDYDPDFDFECDEFDFADEI